MGETNNPALTAILEMHERQIDDLFTRLREVEQLAGETHVLAERQVSTTAAVSDKLDRLILWMMGAMGSGMVAAAGWLFTLSARH